ncbi:hypothetical protein MFLAVUS_010176 [Mucor flavus]|uniref:Dilute domain-containing protein n=1 Tax=Mucor flavus TaxID=439312 RepID=A0ABP9ZC50_9FUNG
MADVIPTQVETSILQTKYEDMSLEEMSQRMQESNRQISEMLSSTSSSLSTSGTVEPEVVNSDQDDPQTKNTNLFSRLASSGNIAKLKEMLSDPTVRPLIDIDARDSDGTPPLIYAACFGKVEVAQVLIEHGANIDAQDSFGWSALMWATNNSHESLVKILLENGASATTKSSKGRTVFDFVNTENQKIVEILTTNPRDSVSSTSSLFYKTTSSVSSSSTENDFYYQQSNDDSLEEAELRKKLFEDTMALVNEFEQSDDDDENDDDNSSSEEDDDDNNLTNEFHWDKCCADQMFVFNSDDLDYILDTVINNIQLPLSNQQDIHIASNVIFLTARFAHYFSTSELLDQVLQGALQRISKSIKIHARNIHLLAFWINNLTRLLYYLKKDSGLVVVTAEQQLQLSELISETYNIIISDTEKRLHKLLSSMTEHEELQVDQIEFTDDWHRFFRSSARKSIENNCSISPQSITSLLSSTLFVLQSYDVHPIVIIQALAQFFHYISCELFNRILTNKKLLCRSKAMQVRMNISHLEDWISVNKLPNHLISYLNPTIQLLQLLQCVTQLSDLVEFINTAKKFDTLNPSQVKRCVVSYRYEVNEIRIPEEVEKYAMQCAEDTVRHKQQRASSRANTSASSRRTSLSQYLTRSSVPTTPITESLPTLHDEPDDLDDTKETKDTKFMLPFSVPTTYMIHENSEAIIPMIPEEWLEKIDTAPHSSSK